jgi:hypothetical protein
MNDGADFQYMVNNQVIDGYGIEIIDDLSLIHTKQDIDISIKSITFLMNLIFDKDRVAGENIEVNLLKRTLSKYIILLEYYGINTTDSAKIMEEINFPIDKEWEEINDKALNGYFNNSEVFESYLNV